MSDRSVHLLIETLDPLILTAEPATEGVPRTLRHIPGAALLGLAAGRVYGKLGDAYRVFHSGAVRFGPGLPVNAGRIGLPAPLSLHARKGEDLEKAGCLAPGVRDLSSEPRDAVQYEQLRDPFVTAGRCCFRVAMTGGLKTAIAPATGRAADGQLYGYAAIRARQVFLARIDATGGSAADAADLEMVVEALCGPGGGPAERRIGRSRSAEFGRVRIRRLEIDDPTAAMLAPGVPRAEGVALYAVSDVHLPLDPRRGQVSLMLGTGASIVASRSFVRARRYSPFNRQWGSRGVERQVWSAGSVVVVTGADPARLADALARGWGLDRELGLGRIARDPVFLEKPVAGTRIEVAPAVRRPASAAERPFFAAMQARAARRRAEVEAGGAAERLLGEIRALHVSAARLQGVAPGRVGPSASQWHAVVQALAAEDWQRQLDLILGGKEDRPVDEAWRVPTGQRGTFAEWLRDKAGDAAAPPAALRLAVEGVHTMLEGLGRAAADDGTQRGAGR